MAARPLSPWVAELDGLGGWNDGAEINFGFDEEDARSLPVFADGWRRASVALPEFDLVALALVHGGTGTTVVELDDAALPIPVTPAQAAELEALEERWPDVDTVSDAFASGDVALRHHLLSRLVEERRSVGSVLFRILPWDEVTALAGQVRGMLHGAPPGRLIVLRHWYTPAGPPFTAALEQLDEGLRDSDPEVTRVGASALCRYLLAFSAGRLPGDLRVALAALLSDLADRDPFLRPAADRLIPRLHERPTDPVEPLGERAPELIASPRDVVWNERTVERAPFTLRLRISNTGLVMVTATVPRPAGDRILLDEGYRVVVLPLVVVVADRASRYLLPLRADGDVLTATMELEIAGSELVEVDLEVPEGVEEIGDADPDDVIRSVQALRSQSDLLSWLRIAEALPGGHPIRILLEGDA